MLIGAEEKFVPFDAFPWFRDATIGELTNVQRPSAHHLYWPDLDVDVAVESLDHPERYPLIAQVPPRGRRKAPAIAVKEQTAAYKRRRGRARSFRST